LTRGSDLAIVTLGGAWMKKRDRRPLLPVVVPSEGLSAPALRAHIAYAGVRRFELAQRLGIHPGTLSHVLNERVPMPPGLAQRILNAIPGPRGLNGGSR
jgi:hypothetical protein